MNVRPPEDYRKFLQEFNGGCITENIYLRIDDKSTCFVSWLFGSGLENGFGMGDQTLLLQPDIYTRTVRCEAFFRGHVADVVGL